MTTNRFARWDAIVIFFIGVMIFTQGLWNQEVIGFESRFYLFALEMWRHGFSWFPTTYHEPYPDYPVTSTALIYLTAKTIGILNKCVAVFPSAAAAALTLSGTYLIGALQARRWGWYGVGFLLFTLAFITEARTISLDMYVTAITTWVFYFAYSAKLKAKSPAWWLIALLLIFSFAIRGPIGIVIPTGVLMSLYLCEKDWRACVLLSVLSLFLLAICTGALLGLAHHVGGNDFMQKVLRMQIFGRMEVNRTPPFYFYFVESFGAFALTYPLAILVLIGISPKLLQKDMQFLRILLSWLLIIMLGLSIPADKKIRYILAISPALALICSYLLMLTHKGFLNWLQKSFYLICWILPVLVLIVLSVLYQREIAVNYILLSTLFVVMQVIMVLTHKDGVHFFLAIATFLLANIYIVEKINLDANRTQALVKNIETLRERQHARLAFFQEGRDGWVIKYLINMPREESPFFISSFQQAPTGSVFVIGSEENFKDLGEKNKKVFRLLGAGKIGRDKVTVGILNSMD